MKESTLNAYRNTDKANVIWRMWYLDSFIDVEISDEYLTSIQDDFDVIRKAGFQVLVRFGYTDKQVFPSF